MTRITFHDPPKDNYQFYMPHKGAYEYVVEGNVTFRYPIKKRVRPRNHHDWYLQPLDMRLLRRNCLGWSQEELAGEIGVDVKTYRRWEADETQPSRSNNEKLLKLFWKEIPNAIEFLLIVKNDIPNRDGKYRWLRPP